MTDNAIKQCKYVIQDAFDFFSWVESMQVSSKMMRRRIKFAEPLSNLGYYKTPCHCWQCWCQLSQHVLLLQ